VYKYLWWDICSIRAQLREHIYPHVVVPNHMMDLESGELVLELAYFLNIRVHGVLVDVPLLVDMFNHYQGVAVDK
jgi:hypothetical protein